jgi:ABC-type transport system involved in cytochrome c biogenesis permease subunit
LEETKKNNDIKKTTMNWIYFPLYALISSILWIVGIALLYASQRKTVLKPIGHFFLVGGIVAITLFVSLLWIYLERPPMRTLGETRLWYSLFLPVIGYITYLRWGYKWFLTYSISLAILFLYINFKHPETHEKTLMPALQSPWFVPHVVVYIFSYALLAASSLVSVKGLYESYTKKTNDSTLGLADNMVYMGFAFLTLGLIFGALWAKQAWGHYWTWDPKETWALLTWLGYLIYIHYRYFHPKKLKIHYWILSLAFVVLLICWFGINYLPSAQNSVHVYAQ